MLRMNSRALYKLDKCFFPSKMKAQLLSFWGMISAFVAHWFEQLIFLPLLPQYWDYKCETPHLVLLTVLMLKTHLHEVGWRCLAIKPVTVTVWALWEWHGKPDQLCTRDALAAAVIQQSLSLYSKWLNVPSPTVSPGTSLACVPLFCFALTAYLQLPARIAISLLNPRGSEPTSAGVASSPAWGYRSRKALLWWALPEAWGCSQTP